MGGHLPKALPLVRAEARLGQVCCRTRQGSTPTPTVPSSSPTPEPTVKSHTSPLVLPLGTASSLSGPFWPLAIVPPVRSDSAQNREVQPGEHWDGDHGGPGEGDSTQPRAPKQSEPEEECPTASPIPPPSLPPADKGTWTLRSGGTQRWVSISRAQELREDSSVRSQDMKGTTGVGTFY